MSSGTILVSQTECLGPYTMLLGSLFCHQHLGHSSIYCFLWLFPLKIVSLLVRFPYSLQMSKVVWCLAFIFCLTSLQVAEVILLSIDQVTPPNTVSWFYNICPLPNKWVLYCALSQKEPK